MCYHPCSYGRHLLIFIMVILTNNVVFAQTDSTKVYFNVPRLEAEIELDARLEEPVWQDAVMVSAEIEVQPGENIPAPVRTTARMFYDESNLYVGIHCHDPHPEKMRAHLTDRDQIWSDDWVLILFDTFNDNRRTYDFACNPLGVQADMVETPMQGSDLAWDTIWDCNARMTDDGYIVEMIIPFRSINFQRSPTDQIWGFDLVRSYPRQVRHHIGAFPRDRNNNCYMCQANKLIGFAGAEPGRNIELAPTVSAIARREREDGRDTPWGSSDRDLESGLTARWGLTPNIVLNGTINPDFSQVEADVFQMDINTRFALFYPERRPFFMEGADYFNTPLQAVYTRTMADPRTGIKLTGKENRHTLGFFSVQDNTTNLLFPASQGSDNTFLDQRNISTALRYKYDLGSASNVGMVLTDREANDYYNRVGGVDGLIHLTRTEFISFQMLGSETLYPDTLDKDFEQPEGKLTGTAFEGFIVHDSKKVEAYAFYRSIDKDFRTDLGFMTQANYGYTELGLQRRWERGKGHWFNRLSIGVTYDHEKEHEGPVLMEGFRLRFLYMGPFQTFCHAHVRFRDQHFEGKTYRTHDVIMEMAARPTGNTELGLQAILGDHIDYDNNRSGTRINLSPSCELFIGRHLLLGLGHDYERLYVDPGLLYTANISRFKVVYQFTRRMFVRTILQYRHYDRNLDLYLDPEDMERSSGTLSSQFLFSYKINPQTVFYLGYSDYHEAGWHESLQQQNRTFFTKLGYAWRI